ncbi:hypothetical protein ABZX85_10020 [Streptomyces sp. NPDC004539]|uniref:hypothetical protein n=1 Tax=Streptomyces sp. NPDC004539 TaxID=3154280 RepID=UPI0033A2C884
MELSAPAVEFEKAVRQGAEPRATALAICTRLGIPRAEAESRLRAADALFTESGPGSEPDLALFLDTGHVFVVDRPLDERETEIRDLLVRATGAMGRVPSGLAHSLGRWWRTGELTRAFLVLARREQVRGDAGAYWSALAAAGELLLGSAGDGVGEAGKGGDESVVTAWEKCRTSAASHTP